MNNEFERMCFRLQVYGAGATTILGPIERARLNHCAPDP